MRVNTQGLEGHLLNFATAIALGARWTDGHMAWPTNPPTYSAAPQDFVNDWAACGALFDKEGIWFEPSDYPDLGAVHAFTGQPRFELPTKHHFSAFGDTRCAAGLRCLIQIKLGDSIEIPDEVVAAMPAAQPSKPRG